MIIDILKLILLVSLCIYTSITDIKDGIVQNKVIAISTILGLVLNAVDWLVLPSENIVVQLLNIIIVDLIALLLYAFHFWAGGDCKLVFAICFLVPYSMYISSRNSQITLPLMLGITFSINYVFLLLNSVFLFIKRKKKLNIKHFAVKAHLVIGKWVSCIAYITLINSIIIHFFGSLSKLYLLLINACLVLIISGLNFLRNKYIVIVAIVTGIIIKLIFKQAIIDKISLISYSLAILFILLKVFIDEYNYQTINTAQVKKGMILSLATTIQFTNSKVQGLPKPSTEDLRSRLSEDEATAVRKWEKSKYGAETVQIVTKIPFAIFISIGTICYIILGVWF